MQTLYPEAKVILLGEFGVGKTSIFRRYSSDTFIDTSGMDWNQYREFTLGLDNYSKKFECKLDNNETKTISLRLYDTGGLERIGSIGNSYYKSAEAALLVFARNNIDSFNCLTQHLLEVLSFGENAKLYLVSNKVDVNDEEVSDDDIRTFMEQFPIIEDHFQVSCKTNKPSVDEMFCEIAQKIANSTSKLSRRLDSIKLTHSSNQHGSGGPSDHNEPSYEHQYERNATDLYRSNSSCSNCN